MENKIRIRSRLTHLKSEFYTHTTKSALFRAGYFCTGYTTSQYPPRVLLCWIHNITISTSGIFVLDTQHLNIHLGYFCAGYTTSQYPLRVLLCWINNISISTPGTFVLDTQYLNIHSGNFCVG